MSFNSIMPENLSPLAQRIRPITLEKFIGQKKIIHKNSLICQSIKNNQPFSMILWGPPGSGKTTLIRILCKEYKIEYNEISAVSSGVKEIRSILDKSNNLFDLGKKNILFIDEIHRFSKSQQDVLLHAIEEGRIVLMGATTENPSFEVISPLLSRCQVIKLDYLNNEELKLIIFRAINEDILLSKNKISISDAAISLLIRFSGFLNHI